MFSRSAKIVQNRLIFGSENTEIQSNVFKMFSQEPKTSKKPLILAVLSTLGTIRTRLYYFPNSRKHALFGTYLQVQFHGISPASHASTKNVFKNVFTEDRFETCYIFWRATALFKDMYDVAFTDNSIPHAVQEVQSKKQLKQHLIIACWKCYNSIDILPRQS